MEHKNFEKLPLAGRIIIGIIMTPFIILYIMLICLAVFVTGLLVFEIFKLLFRLFF